MKRSKRKQRTNKLILIIVLLLIIIYAALKSISNGEEQAGQNNKMEELSKNVSFSFWEKLDEEHTIVRFATSWATKEEDVDALIQLL